jgi:phospholipid-binding lipoprotein MlaA
MHGQSIWSDIESPGRALPPAGWPRGRHHCRRLFIAFFLSLALVLSHPCTAAQHMENGGDSADQTKAEIGKEISQEDIGFGDEPWEDETEVLVADPLEPINRLFFRFNDRVYYLLFKPTATVYSHIVAKDIRICVRNAFVNLLAPVRVVNTLLQGKMKAAGTETGRFFINSTLGIGGCGDVAESEFGLARRDEDFGQTLGFYGAGAGFYIVWPFIGPSNVRDTIGLVGDTLLDPLLYAAGGDLWLTAGIYGGKKINHVSLSLGDYELFTKTALDPYAALRDAYQQFRQGKIDDSNLSKDNLIDKGEHL